MKFQTKRKTRPHATVWNATRKRDGTFRAIPLTQQTSSHACAAKVAGSKSQENNRSCLLLFISGLDLDSTSAKNGVNPGGLPYNKDGVLVGNFEKNP